MADVGALRVSLTLDSADFSRSMQDINRKLKGLQSEFKASTAGNKLFENSLDGMKLKSNHLSQVLTLQKERVEQLRRQYEHSVATKGKDAKETENLLIRYNNALAAMKKTEAELNTLNRQIQLQSSTWYKLGESLKSVGDKMKTIGDSMKSAGQTMTTRVTLPIVGLGAAIIKTGADFEESMSKVATISGATGKDFEKLKEQAKELGSKTKFSASEAASGMQFLAMAGFETNEIMSAMPGLLDLAAAGAVDLGRAADITSNIMSGFGIEASKAGHVADVLAKASSSANTNVQQLGEAMVYLAPISKTLGWTMEEATAAVMALSDAGIQGAQAGAAFSTSLGRLAKPTDEMRQVMNQLGISFFDAQGNMKPLPAVIAELERATKGMTAEQKSAVLTTLFGAEAYKHWAVLIDKGSEALGANTEMLVKADGAAKQMAETMSKNTKGAWKEFQSALEGLSIALSEHLLPYVTKIVKTLTDWVRKFAELDSSTQKVILALAGIIAALGPILILIGNLVSSIGGAILVFGKLAGSIAAAGGLLPWLGGVLTALTGPIGIAIAAITGLTVGGIALYKHFKKSSIEVDLFGENVSKATQKAVGGFLKLNDQATQALNQLDWSGQVVTQSIVDNIVSKFNQMGDRVLTEMQKDHQAQLTEMQNFFTKSSALTDEEEKKALEKLRQHQQNQQNTIRQGQQRIAEILNKAKEEKRSITDAERQEINQIQRQMVETGIRHLSQNELEAKSILERMKAQAGELSAQQAAEVVKNSKKQKDEAIKAANEQYDKVVQEIIRQRDEVGSITAEQANKLIQEATRQRDEAVKKATDMHNKVVEEAKKQAGEHVNQVNWETGQVLSKWEVFKNDMQSKWEAIKTNTKNKLIEMGNDIKSKYEELSIKIPKPKLPDINVSWKSFGIGDLSVKIPKFSINWHAIGGVFENPIVFGNAGFGDVEEAIVPFEGRHARKIAGLIAREMPQQQPAINITLNYTGNNINDANRMIDIIERELGSRMSTRLRMSGVRV